MSRVAAVGSWAELAGYALVGVEVVDASGPDAVRRAWEELPEDVGLVLLTAEARRSLPDELLPRERLWVVTPG
jgi:vacuolar-type H+-ATPase subunit F/Vma7